MLTKPRWMLHLEGAAIFVAAIYFYNAGHFSWWLIAALFLAPDLFMLGYLKDPRWGSAAYNLVHTLTGPLLLLGIECCFHASQYLPYVLIWLGHIDLDRALGFGLKYPTFFKDTHLQHV
jgi:Domain of unknown function (DUF4260)